MIRPGGGAGLLLLAVLCSGCASALKEPPAVTEIAVAEMSEHDLASTVDELLAEADLEMSKVPERAAVKRARALYLEAAKSCEAPAESFHGAARATAWLIEHESDGPRREELAIEGVQIAQLCRDAFPGDPECRYRLALAVGQQARERPSTAMDGLEVMVALLEELVEQAPHLDRAGPHRVLALVLLRAPAWPSGPGDPEYGLEHARTAAELAPAYPPNQLVLGEALVDNGRREEARLPLEGAVELARAARAGGDGEADEWLARGMEALAGLD